MASSCKHGRKPLDFVKFWKFFDQLSDCYILKRTLLHGVK